MRCNNDIPVHHCEGYLHIATIHPTGALQVLYNHAAGGLPDPAETPSYRCTRLWICVADCSSDYYSRRSPLPQRLEPDVCCTCIALYSHAGFCTRTACTCTVDQQHKSHAMRSASASAVASATCAVQLCACCKMMPALASSWPCLGNALAIPLCWVSACRHVTSTACSNMVSTAVLYSGAHACLLQLPAGDSMLQGKTV
jgi:hypothetical protein